MAQPLVCICIPVYNAQATIQQTLASILGQTYQNIKVHVIDNCSTDKTVELISSFSDPRLQLYRNETNIGGDANYNRCIELATGDYTAIYHADDIYEPDIVQQQVDFLEQNTEAGAVLTQALLIDEQSKPIKYCYLPPEVKTINNLYTLPQLVKAIIKHANFLFTPTGMVRTHIYQKEIATWRADLFASSADLDIWLRIAQHHLLGVIPKALIRYRISNSQWTAKVRRSTLRADFFSVMDYYVQLPEINKVLSKEDLEQYSNLERRDRMMRTVNLFMENRGIEAKPLCYDVFYLDTLKAALKSKRGALTLALGVMTRFFLFLNLERAGKKIFTGLIVKFKK